MKERKQIVLIHGGNTFKNRKDYLNFLKTRNVSIEKKKKWGAEYLDKKLGKKFEIIRPQMPLKDNAKYEEWKIFFERYFPYLRDDLVLIGSSLGGIFLAKYLSENKFPKRISSTHLVCPPFDNSIEAEDLVGGFDLKNNLSLVEKNSPRVFLHFSKDDPVIPLSHAEKYKKKLRGARIFLYDGKNGHFKVPEFPELVKLIKRFK